MDRYSRQIILPEIGEEGQKKLQKSKVLLIGVGGLGSPVSMYLTAAGIGTLGLVDDDIVSLTNLQRQILYTEEEVGQKKVNCAQKRLASLNSNVSFCIHNKKITPTNASELIDGYDIVVDACDNYETRYLVSDICLEKKIPYVYGAIVGWQGQVSLFGVSQDKDTKAPSYRDLFPEPPICSAEDAPLGVIGVTAGLIGSVQAAQTIKVLCGQGEWLDNKLWTVDLKSLETHVFSF